LSATIHWLGHATAVIELDGVRIITDPVLRNRIAHLRRRVSLPGPVQPEAVDAVLISHIHQDHLDLPSLKRLGREARLIVPVGAARIVWRHGFRHVDELRPGEAATVGPVRVVATPANHNGFRPPFGPRAACLGFIVEGSEAVYFAGDTDLFPEMASLGRVDVALLPVWGWGPTLGPGHLDPQRATEALARIRPRIAIPVHWGTLHPITLSSRHHAYLHTPPLEFAAIAAEQTPDVAVQVIAPGGVLERAHKGVGV
jgi:L-ascorbate metabolism protein UlaG (beta-lactamase superfamily)